MPQITNLPGEQAARGNRTCVNRGAKPPRLAGNLSFDYDISITVTFTRCSFGTCRVWSLSDSGSVIRTRGEGVRSFTRSLHSRAEWVARDRRPSFAGLNSRYPFKERRSMTDATTRHVVDNGGKKWGRREEATINRVPFIWIFSSPQI